MGCCAAFDEAAHKLIKQLVQHTSRRVGEPEPSIARVATPTGELLRKVVVFKVALIRLRKQRGSLAFAAAAAPAAAAAVPGRGGGRRAARGLARLHRELRPPSSTTRREPARHQRARLQATALPELVVAPPPAPAPAAAAAVLAAAAPAVPQPAPAVPLAVANVVVSHFTSACGPSFGHLPASLAPLATVDSVGASALPFRAAHFFGMLPADVVSAAGDAAVAATAHQALLRLVTRPAVSSLTITRFRRHASLGPKRHVDSDFTSFRVAPLWSPPRAGPAASLSASELDTSSSDSDSSSESSPARSARVVKVRRAPLRPLAPMCLLLALHA